MQIEKGAVFPIPEHRVGVLVSRRLDVAPEPEPKVEPDQGRGRQEDQDFLQLVPLSRMKGLMHDQGIIPSFNRNGSIN